jgi:hypothetical protein
VFDQELRPEQALLFSRDGRVMVDGWTPKHVPDAVTQAARADSSTRGLESWQQSQRRDSRSGLPQSTFYHVREF